VIGVIVVADTGAALRRLSMVVSELPDVHIIRHCNGNASVVANVAATAADIVLLAELRWPRVTVKRVAEISALRRPRILVSASELGAGWLADALRAGASALVPQSADAGTLRVVIDEVIASGASEGLDRPGAQAA